jgi:hypothetical protein
VSLERTEIMTCFINKEMTVDLKHVAEKAEV